MKPNILHYHVTGDGIFVDDDTYNNQMNATERHTVFQIRSDMKALKDPLGRNTRKRTSEVAALQRSVHELSAVLTISLTTAVKTTVAVANTLTKLTADPIRTSLDLVASLTLIRSRKALVIDLN